MGSDHKPDLSGFFVLRMKRLISNKSPTLIAPLMTGEMNHEPIILAVEEEKIKINC